MCADSAHGETKGERENGNMSMFSNPVEHAANAPETWSVVKLAPQAWALVTSDGTELDRFRAKYAAEQARVSGHLVRLYQDETRWYAGESVRGWKPYTGSE